MPLKTSPILFVSATVVASRRDIEADPRQRRATRLGELQQRLASLGFDQPDALLLNNKSSAYSQAQRKMSSRLHVNKLVGVSST